MGIRNCQKKKKKKKEKGPLCPKGMILPSVVMGLILMSMISSCHTCQTAVPGSEILKLVSHLAEIRIGLIEGACSRGTVSNS